ncbi:MAG: shikimate kinase [Tenericutes bacterium HGW-Tenericutes-2]|jgi:shikimate kinase|nr:MAG: shikimate kinase [Tenericutes bacterium HGW-Tenericutes-2]
MKLVIITGPHAVGKMTVGQELTKITPLKLFHNHISIELVASLMPFGTPFGKELNERIRSDVFDVFSKSEEYGLIFTFMWAFDMKEDWNYIEKLENLFTSRGAEVYYVELEADYELRLSRNKTANRLNEKPTKRNLEFSESMFKNLEEKYRLNSHDGEIKKKHYLRINNTNLEPKEVASQIKEVFDL